MEANVILRCGSFNLAHFSQGVLSVFYYVTGIEVLNGAAEKVYSRVPPEKWVFVSVAVAPSTITISEHGVCMRS